MSASDLYAEIEMMGIRHYPTYSIIKMLCYCLEHPESETGRLDRVCGFGTERLTLSLLKKFESKGLLTKRRSVFGYLWTVTEFGKQKLDGIKAF